jgi:poly-gamma-glutamate capsule biosynthesis protein CapA/YwtB (metallophosphatase superfamily)
MVAAALLAGCTGGDGPAAGPETRAPTSSTATEDPRTDVASGEPPAAAAFTQPLVVISSLHRPRLRLTVAEARSLVRGRIDPVIESIRRQTGGQASLYRGTADARNAVEAVARGRSAIAVVPAADVRPTVQTAIVAGLDPLRAPSRYPLRVPADEQQADVTTLTFVGDIMLGRGVAAARPRDPGSALRAYAALLRAPDLTVGNLESTLSSDGQPRQGDDSFAADPSVVPDLERAGFDVLTLANNHTGDYGPTALRQTLGRLDNSRIDRVGAGRDAADAWAPVVLRRNGVTFGFLAFNAIGETPRATAHSPGVAEIRMQPRLGPLNDGDLARMSAAIGRLADRTDVVTVLPHWGDQYTHVAVPDQRRVARALIDAGADLVVGSHPHWVQGMAARARSVTAFSLGNFVFDMDFDPTGQTMEGVALDATFWGDRLMSATPQPYVLDPRFAPHPATGSDAAAILDDVWQSSFGILKGRELSPAS